MISTLTLARTSRSSVARILAVGSKRPVSHSTFMSFIRLTDCFPIVDELLRLIWAQRADNWSSAFSLLEALGPCPAVSAKHTYDNPSEVNLRLSSSPNGSTYIFDLSFVIFSCQCAITNSFVAGCRAADCKKSYPFRVTL